MSSIHTSVRLPSLVRQRLEQERKKRGLATFSDVIQEAVRFYLKHDSEWQGVEQRIASSMERLGRQLEEGKDESRAIFAMCLALARELLPPDGVERLLRNATADFAGVEIPAANTPESPLPAFSTEPPF